MIESVGEPSADERAEMEKHGIFHGPLTDEERKAKRQAWEATLRWPLRGVVSEDFAALREHDRLHQMALGNLQSSKSLCIELGENPDRISWPRGAVVYYLTHFAVELFLKACLLRGGRRFDRTHEISELQDAFDEAFPNHEGVHTMWDINVVELAILGPVPDRRIPAREDQFLRYFDDDAGTRGEWSFAPAVFISEIEGLEEQFARVWKELPAAVPNGTAR
ncbi:MAG: hypothetical protein AB1938_16045 [Myxococcota bacterium]